MKFSWTSLQISIAGARLSHLVQKDKIWDHGSMIENSRILFYLVQKAMNTGKIESLKKHVTLSCYQELEKEMDSIKKKGLLNSNENPVITELAVISVCERKNNKPDMFKASIKGYLRKEGSTVLDNNQHRFSFNCSFVRQGDWWLLHEMKH
ncbi:TIM44-like domain-containing protein [Lacibacter sediminis]